MINKTISIILLICAVLTFAVFPGCKKTGSEDVTSSDTSLDTSSDTDAIPEADSGPFGNGEFHQERYTVTRLHGGLLFSTIRPLRMLDLETGEVSVVCPDPSCTHDANTPSCIYNSITFIRAAGIGGGYVLFIASHWHGEPDGLYLFDVKNNMLNKLRDIAYCDINIIYDEGKFYFLEYADVKDLKGDFVKRIIELDPATGNETIKAYITSAENLYDHTQGYIVTRYGFSQSFTRISDEDTDVRIKILTPDGNEEHNILKGYVYLIGGIAVKYSAPSSVYLYDKADYVELPVNCQIGSTQRVDGTIVFQTVSKDPKYALTGTDEEGNVINAYSADPVIYFLNPDGTYDVFELETDYSFSVAKVYGHKILAVSDTRKEGDRLIVDGNQLVILFDLDTGKTIEYDFDAYDKELKFIEIPTKEFTTKINKLH